MPNLRLLLWAKKRGNASGFEFGQRAPACATHHTRGHASFTVEDAPADAAMVTMQSITMATTHAAASRWFRAAPTGSGTCGGDTGARVKFCRIRVMCRYGYFGSQLRAAPLA
jgi:hypothetical protein